MTRLEVIDGEALEPLTEAKAKALDEKIRVAGKKFAHTWFELLTLLEQAEQGQIHVALGFRSWPEYLADAVRIAPIDKNERKLMAALMSGEGMSQRAIAAVLDVDQKTVSNDLRSGEENSSTATAGLDGKSYKRKPKRAAPKPKITPPLNIAESEAVAALNKAVDGIASLAHGDQFITKRGKFVSHRPDLQRAIETLQKVVDKIDGDDTVKAQS